MSSRRRRVAQALQRVRQRGGAPQRRAVARQAALAGRHPLVVADAQRLCARRTVAKINGDCARRDWRHPACRPSRRAQGGRRRAAIACGAGNSAAEQAIPAARRNSSLRSARAAPAAARAARRTTSTLRSAIFTTTRTRARLKSSASSSWRRSTRHRNAPCRARPPPGHRLVRAAKVQGRASGGAPTAILHGGGVEGVDHELKRGAKLKGRGAGTRRCTRRRRSATPRWRRRS